MGFRGDVAGSIHRLLLGPVAPNHGARATSFVAQPSFALPRRRLAGSFLATLICVLAAAAVAGCGGGVGSLMVDPGLYSAYHCNDLVGAWNNLVKREKDLRGLIDKAREGGGGTVIGAVAYRGDYETVLAREKVLKRTAAEKNCALAPTYKSDQTIR
jgi:hypothetical protein